MLTIWKHARLCGTAFPLNNILAVWSSTMKINMNDTHIISETKEKQTFQLISHYEVILVFLNLYFLSIHCTMELLKNVLTLVNYDCSLCNQHCQHTHWSYFRVWKQSNKHIHFIQRRYSGDWTIASTNSNQSAQRSRWLVWQHWCPSIVGRLAPHPALSHPEDTNSTND
jgi:hypothetical protein